MNSELLKKASVDQLKEAAITIYADTSIDDEAFEVVTSLLEKRMPEKEYVDFLNNL